MSMPDPQQPTPPHPHYRPAPHVPPPALSSPRPFPPGAPLPPGARLKGTRRLICGIVLAALGSMASCGGLVGSYDENAGNPLPGGILLLGIGGWLIWWGIHLRSQRIVTVRPTSAPRASVPPNAPIFAPSRNASQTAQSAVRYTPPAPTRWEPSTPPPVAHYPAPSVSSPDWVPPHPEGTPTDAWAPGHPVEIVGEWAVPESFTRLLGDQPGFRDYGGADIHGEALLVHDPGNPYGRGHAVAVFFEGEPVGHLSQQDADAYWSQLAEMHADGAVLRAPARAWASQPDGHGSVQARVTVTLPDPGGLLPTNPLPDGDYVVIPPGRSIQVTKESEHMDVLQHHVLRGPGADNHLAATLRSINEIRPRSAYECVQVEIDGQRVGVLTKGQSDKLLPLVRHIEQRGLVPVVRATVRGTRLQADVTLRCADAQTIDDDWLDKLGEQTTDANIDATPKRPAHDWDDDPQPSPTTSPDW